MAPALFSLAAMVAGMVACETQQDGSPPPVVTTQMKDSWTASLETLKVRQARLMAEESRLQRPLAPRPKVTPALDPKAAELAMHRRAALLTDRQAIADVERAVASIDPDTATGPAAPDSLAGAAGADRIPKILDSLDTSMRAREQAVPHRRDAASGSPSGSTSAPASSSASGPSPR